MSDNKGVVTFHGAGLTFVGLETGQVSVTPTAVEVVPGEHNRGRIILSNVSGTTTIFIGRTDGVTVTDGFAIPSGTMTPLLEYTGPVYAIVNTVTSPLTWITLK